MTMVSGVEVKDASCASRVWPVGMHSTSGPDSSAGLQAALGKSAENSKEEHSYGYSMQLETF